MRGFNCSSCLNSGKLLNAVQTSIHLEGLVRSGKVDEARAELEKLARRGIKREDALAAAEIARRLNLPLTSLRILSKYVRGSLKGPASATVEETLEYAGALIQIGAQFEAEVLLSKISSVQAPKVLLLRSFLCFARWQYREALPLLKEYLHKDLNSYDRIVAQLNYAAALVDQKKTSESEKLISELLKLTDSKDLKRVKANVYEIQAENLLVQKRFSEAVKVLALAEKELNSAKVWDGLHIKKWKLFAEASHLSQKKLLSRAAALTETAREIHDWESVREIDRFLCLKLSDFERLQHLYFGTPYDAYRKRLLYEFGEKTIPKQYNWFASDSTTAKRTLNLSDGTIEAVKEPLQNGGVLHRLIQGLLSDFYLPKGIGSLHALIYPGEYFNPISGPSKVHRVISRAREWIKKEKLGFEIIEVGTGYQLLPSSKVKVRITANDSRKHPEVRILFDRFQDGFFTSSQAGKVLQIPSRTLRRYLTELVSVGALERTGEMTKSKYRVIKKRS